MAKSKSVVGYVDEHGNYHASLPENGVVVNKFDYKNKSNPDLANLDLANLDLANLALSGGAGLLSYTMADQMLNDGNEKKKRNAFDRLLSKLIPIGIGGLGAYGGYYLGERMKKADAPMQNGGQNAQKILRPVISYPEDKEKGEAIAFIPVDENGNAKLERKWTDLVRDHSKERGGIPMPQAFEEVISGENLHSNVGAAFGTALDIGGAAALGRAGIKALDAKDAVTDSGYTLDQLKNIRDKVDSASKKVLDRVPGSGSLASGKFRGSKEMTGALKAQHALEQQYAEPLGVLGKRTKSLRSAKRWGKGGALAILASALPWLYSWYQGDDAEHFQQASENLTEKGKTYVPGQ